MSKKININEIIEMYSTFEFHDGTIHFYKEKLIESYVNFAKQLLELAAENVILDLNEDSSYDFVENFPKNLSFQYEGCPELVSINEQSILDTIKQIE